MDDGHSAFGPEETDAWTADDARWEAHYARRVPYEGPLPTRLNTQPLPESFGRSLDTMEKARLWLTNPHNWHDTNHFVLKWNGLSCTVNKRHGKRLIMEPWDNGLPWCAVYEQQRRRNKNAAGEPLEEAGTTAEAPESSE